MTLQRDVIIIGASFAGLACAKALVAAGCSVTVLERKADVGKGLHTTGILVDEAIDLLQLPEHLRRSVSSVKLFAPSGQNIEVQSDSYIFQTTNTPDVMRFMLEDARQAGVEVLLDCPLERGTEAENHVDVNGGAFRAKYLVGADGAKSKTARVFGLGRNTRFLVGVEAEYAGLKLGKSDTFYCFLGRKHAPGYIGWAIPGPDVLQVGLAVDERYRPDLPRFFKSISHHLEGNAPAIVERRGGVIPISGLVERFHSDRVILVGDAAGLVSPLTAGGIHTGLHYGRRLGELLAARLSGGDHPGRILKREYPRFRTKHIMRSLFDQTPDWGFNAMISSPLSQPLANAIFFLKKRLPKSRTRSVGG